MSEGEDPGGGGAECCRRMQRTLREEFERRFHQIELNMTKKEEELKLYVDKLKESISLRDEMIKKKDQEIARQGKIIQELKEKNENQGRTIQEMERRLASGELGTSEERQDERGRERKTKKWAKNKTNLWKTF